jgi:hypothetical protein
MADANADPPGRGAVGTNLVLVLLVAVVLGLVVWLVLSRGDDADVEINAPAVEAPATPDVEVKSSDGK